MSRPPVPEVLNGFRARELCQLAWWTLRPVPPAWFPPAWHSRRFSFRVWMFWIIWVISLSGFAGADFRPACALRRPPPRSRGPARPRAPLQSPHSTPAGWFDPRCRHITPMIGPDLIAALLPSSLTPFLRSAPTESAIARILVSVSSTMPAAAARGFCGGFAGSVGGFYWNFSETCCHG